MTRIISHTKYSETTAKLIEIVTKESDQSESQCYAMACLGALWLCRGEEGRKKIHMYCQILQELSLLSDDYPSCDYLELIDLILSKKLPPERIANFTNIDKDHTILKLLPISSVIHFLYFSPELKPEFPKILSMPEFSDQDFIKSDFLLDEIIKDENLITKLEKVFPQYQTLAGQSFKNDLKLIESQWKCISGNVTKEFPEMTLTKNGLKIFCSWIKDTINAEPDNIENKYIQMIISIESHAITLQYDAITHKWYIVDSLNMMDENIITGLNDADMLDKLFSYLLYNEDEITFSCVVILDKKMNINNFSLDACFDMHKLFTLKLNDGSKKLVMSDINDTIIYLKNYPEHTFEIMNDLLDKIDKNDKMTISHDDVINLIYSLFYSLDITIFNNEKFIDKLLKLLSLFRLTNDDKSIIIPNILSNINDINIFIKIMQVLCINADIKNANGESLFF